MAFVHEPIPDADKQKIGLERQVKELRGFDIVPRDWVVDRERDLYLVCYGTRAGHTGGQSSQYGFGYKGLGFIELRVIETASEAWNLSYQVLPVFGRNLEPHREAMLPLIREAMRTYAKAWQSRTLSLELAFVER